MKKQMELNKPRLTPCGFDRALEELHPLYKTEAALRQAMWRGKIPYRRKGRKIFFYVEELQAWIAKADSGVTLEDALANK